MAERDRHHRQPHDPPIVPVHAERDGEQPAHAGIEAVKGPESRQREPRPYLGHVNLVCRQPRRSARTADGTAVRIAIGVRRTVSAFEPYLMRTMWRRPLHEELGIE